MSAYTPGPWRLAETVRPSVRIGERVLFTGSLNDAQGIADAHLIAAAPELLEALQMAFDEAIFPSKRVSPVYEKAKAAIAKATREQQ